MKELSIEEKAKRYESALEKCRKLYKEAKANEYISDIEDYETIFPELRESEDWRIKKALTEGLCDVTGELGWSDFGGIPIEEIQDWLEKQGQKKCIDDLTQQEAMDIAVAKCFEQGEQKPADKVEPKFKIGDWIAYNHNPNLPPRKIIQITNEHYVFNNGSFEIKTLEADWHLWTIQDAKPGDVIAEDTIERHPSSFVAIYKKQNEEDFDSYCFVGFDGKFYEGEYGHSSEDIHPATKEQRDLLFQKIHEAGYTWNVEKKELMEIEEELTDFEKSLKHIMIETLECGDIRNLKADAEMLLRLAQKSTEWSEEDERAFHHVLSVLEDYGEEHPSKSKFVCNWLKSIKARMGGDKV